MQKMMLNTAVETQGTTPLANYQKLAPVTDTFLFDIKQINSEHHKALFGIGNEGIRRNLGGWWTPALTSLSACRWFAAITTRSMPLPGPLITYKAGEARKYPPHRYAAVPPAGAKNMSASICLTPLPETQLIPPRS